jgi:MFS family permease
MTESEEGARSAKKFAGIEIPPDLKWSNFFSMYLATFIMSCLMILPAVLQPAFLKEIIQIPEEQAGSLNAGLQSMSYVATLLFVGLVGIFSDKVGRRILAITGFVACGVFYIMFGWAKDISLVLGITTVGGQIIVTYVMRFLVGMSLITCYPQFIALVADYTDKRDRGKGMALNGIMMGLGSMVVFAVLAQIARKTGLMSLFYVAGAIGFLGALVSRIWLVDRMPKEKPDKLGIQEIYRVVSKSLPLKVSYFTTFIARPDTSIIATFLILWMVYAADTYGVSHATARGSMVMATMGIVSFFAFPVVGVLLDRWGRVPVLICGLVSGGLGLCLAGVTGNPFSPVMYLCLSLMGLGIAGAVPGANTIASECSPKPIVGSILGGLNSMHPLGVLFFLQVGGLLFDKVGYNTPFIMKGIVNLVWGLSLFIIRKRVVIAKLEEEY